MDGPSTEPDAIPDAAPDAIPDAAPDASPCPAQGAPTVVSATTLPDLSGLRVADNGQETMAVWSVGEYGRYTAWAKMEGGVVVAHGDSMIDIALQDLKLAPMGDTFVLYGGNTLLVFNGAGWDQHTVPGAAGQRRFVVSGTRLLSVLTSPSPYTAALFDGTSFGPAVPLAHAPVAVAGDGMGGFGVVTAQTVTQTSSMILRLTTNGGAGWSPESLIEEVDASSITAELVRYGASWVVLYRDKVGILSGSTWSFRTFSDATVIAANGTKLAVAGATGFTATYVDGVWTSHPLPLNQGYDAPHLAAFSDGFVMVYGGGYGGLPLRAAIHDGDAWGPATIIEPTSHVAFYDVATSNDRVAVAFRGANSQGRIAIHDGASWGIPIDVVPAPPYSFFAVAVEDGAFRTVYLEPGIAVTRLAPASTWSSPEVVPATPAPGEVHRAALARNASGRVVAAWVQTDGWRRVLYVAEFDGLNWGPPVEIEDATWPSLQVVTNGSGFLVRWNHDEDAPRAALWTGSGVGPVISNPGDIASDGTAFVAARKEFASGVARWRTSADGATWSSWSPLGAADEELSFLRSGAGVVVAHTTAGIRVWQSGAWTEPEPTWFGCFTPIGNGTVLNVCGFTPGSMAATRLYEAGTWTTLPNPPLLVGLSWAGLAPSGADYRVDGVASGTFRSTVLHDGSWSTPVDSPVVSQPRIVAGMCGGWAIVHGGSELHVATADGANAYVPDHSTGLVDLTSPPSYVPGPQGFDAFWLAPGPSSLGLRQLHVQLGL